jgi:hypothetical protein
MSEYEWHRWYAWLPVRLYPKILGQQTSLEPFPRGHRGKLFFLKWIERRRVVIGDLIDCWEYRYVDPKTNTNASSALPV